MKRGKTLKNYSNPISNDRRRVKTHSHTMKLPPSDNPASPLSIGTRITAPRLFPDQSSLKNHKFQIFFKKKTEKVTHLQTITSWPITIATHPFYHHSTALLPLFQPILKISTNLVIHPPQEHVALVRPPPERLRQPPPRPARRRVHAHRAVPAHRVQVQVLLQEVGKLRGIALGADDANGFVRVNGLGKLPKIVEK
jgi:hypothetical protein